MEVLPLNHETILPPLQSCRLGRNLSVDELMKLFEFCKLQRYEPAEPIIEEGAVNHDMYVVVRNTVVVEMTSLTTGAMTYIDTLTEGEIIGETALFMNVKRTARVRAADEAELLRLTRDDFFKLLGERPKIGMKLLFMIIYSLLGRLRAANEELAFERRLDSNQDEIDDLVDRMFPQEALDAIFEAESDSAAAGKD